MRLLLPQLQDGTFGAEVRGTGGGEDVGNCVNMNCGFLGEKIEV